MKPMKLYTSKVVAQWLCLTERRVRQLRDEGVIVEARPGLYELQPTVARYITYIGGAGKETLTNERMTLEREKLELLRMRATGTVDVPDIDGGEEFDEEDMT